MSNVSGKIYIAIVEDDESLSRSLTRLLRASGYHPVSYDSAESFLSDKKHPAFDCLVVDIQLGGMSGIELDEQLTSTGSTAPVIFVTAHENAHELEESLRNRCTEFVRKSDPGDALLTFIDQAIQTINSQPPP